MITETNKLTIALPIGAKHLQAGDKERAQHKLAKGSLRGSHMLKTERLRSDITEYYSVCVGGGHYINKQEALEEKTVTQRTYSTLPPNTHCP